MKKIVVVSLIIAMISTMSFGLSSCGKKTDNNMVVGVGNFIDTLNPMSAYTEISAEVINLIYDPLVRYDEKQEPEKSLAKSWELSKDKLTWTFNLVDTKWHDGKKFTSEDVKWTYDTMLKTELGYMYEGYLEGITSITCPDDNTVVIKTEKPKANMLQNTTPILPKHIWEKVKEDDLATWKNEKPVGTGPFIFGEMSKTSITLTQNKDYFSTPTNLKALTFVEYKSSDSMAQALKTGEIDATTSLNASQKATLKDDKNVKVITGSVRGFTQLGVNVSTESKSKGNELLKDKAIRQALEYSIDKKKAIEMLYDNVGEVGTTLINPNDKFHYEPTKEEQRNFNIEKAKTVLENAGYKDTNNDGIREGKNGEKLQFELLTVADNTDEVKFGQMIKSNAKKIGIEIDSVTIDSGALEDRIKGFDYDMFIWGWGADVDPTVILNILTTKQIGGSNEPGWSNPEYDKLVKEQAETMDENKRITMVQDAQKIAHEEAPYIILVYDNYTQAYRSDRWENIKQIPKGGTYFLNLTNINYMNVKSK